MPDPNKCAHCGAPIWWVRGTAGNLLAIDPEPSADGNVTLDEDGRATVGLGGLFVTDGPLYWRHYDVCPRRRKGGK